MSIMACSKEINDCYTGQGAQFNPKLASQSYERWESYQLLKKAVRHGNKEEAKRLLQQGAPVNVHSQFPSGYHTLTPLHFAVHLGCLELIKALLDQGASVNKRDLFYESPLILSVRLRKFSITDLLLTANVTEEPSDGFWLINHLHIACLRNNMSAVKKLISLGADVNEAVGEKSLHWAGYTALHFAVESHSIDIVKLLLDNGADMMKKNAKSLTPLHLADEVRNEIIIDILLSAQMLQLGNPQDCRGLSHFHIACTRNNVNVVEYFLKQGVNVNFQVSRDLMYKWSQYEPLTFAVHYECPEVVETLLLHGARLRNSEDDTGCVELAYDIGNEEIINLLLAHKSAKSKQFSVRKEMSEFQIACAENNVKKIGTMLTEIQKYHPLELNKPLWSLSMPFHLLVKNLSIETMELFRKSGGDVSMRDARGQTPLHILFEKNCGNIIEESMLEVLADFERNPADEFGLSHFHIICTTKRKEMIDKFLANGANVNCTVYNNSLRWPGWSPLHFAVKFRKSKTIDTLLKHGASISIKDSNGLTPFDIAIVNLNHYDRPGDETRHFKIVRKLLLEAEKPCQDFNKRGFSLLHVLCVTQDEPDFVQLASYADTLPRGIDQSIDFPKSRYHLYTPLHFAMENCKFEIGKWLIGRGANIFLEDCTGYSPLRYEVNSKGKYGILKNNPEFLLKSENSSNFYGCSLFLLSCFLNDQKMMEYYLRSGFDINSTREHCSGYYDTETPLHSVISSLRWKPKKFDSNNVVNTAKFLLENGADANARDANLNTPLLCMEHYFNKELIKLLVDYGADINAVNIFDETSLYQACRGIEMSKKVLLLLEYGADMNIENDQGKTPFTHICDLFMDGGDCDGKVVMALVRHAKKLMVLGFHVSEKNRLMCGEFLENYDVENFDEAAYEERCLREIERMKDQKINQYTTVYNVLHKTRNEMAYLSRNSALQELIDSNEFTSSFPLYGFLVKVQFRRGLLRKSLLEKCKKAICSMVGFSAESAEKILDFLDDNDLHNIIKSEKITLIV